MKRVPFIVKLTIGIDHLSSCRLMSCHYCLNYNINITHLPLSHKISFICKRRVRSRRFFYNGNGLLFGFAVVSVFGSASSYREWCNWYYLNILIFYMIVATNRLISFNNPVCAIIIFVGGIRRSPTQALTRVTCGQHAEK